MSRPNASWTWRHAILKSNLPATTRHVLLTISCFMNDTGDGCYPTTKQLAEASGLSERAVCEHIGKATAAGWLVVTVHGFKGQKWKNNQYEAAWPEEKSRAPDDGKVLTEDQCQGTDGKSAASEKALIVVPIGTDPDDRKALTEGQSTSPITNPITNTLSETSSDGSPEGTEKRKRKPAYTGAFEAFWLAYPRSPNMSKAEAFAEWRKLGETDQVACVAAVPGYIAYLKSKPWQQTIDACRFISKRRFDGYATVPGEAAAAVDDDRWQKRLRYSRKESMWPVASWGPAPGKPGCLVPPALLESGDGEGWAEMEKAA